jgi:hypothetical protein
MKPSHNKHYGNCPGEKPGLFISQGTARLCNIQYFSTIICRGIFFPSRQLLSRQFGEAEATIRDAKGITDDNIRISYQIRVQSDLSLRPLMTVSETGMDPGNRPQE